MESCLSPKVRHIICDICSETGDHSEGFINDSGMLQWNVIDKIMPAPVATEDEDMEYFVCCVRSLSPVLRAVNQHYVSVSVDDIFIRQSKYLAWTSQPSVLCQCFQLTKEDSRVGSIHSLLMCTSILERSLGDLYLLRGKQCPSMLKDLLVTDELNQLLGNTTLHVLRVLIGPPISLNLRNVLWHGFPSPGEIHPRFVYMLLCVMMSIGRLLEEAEIFPDQVTHRPWMTFPQLDKMEFALLADVPITERGLAKLQELILGSSFVEPSMIDLWTRGINMYRVHRYGKCVSLLLPQLEHGLRREFAHANNCPHRVLTAENTVLFTTLDEILSPYLEDNTENKLRYVLGDYLMMMLLDLLCYPAGPRLRDRVSHGETNIVDTGSSVGSVLLAVCTLCVWRGHYSADPDDLDDIKPTGPMIAQLKRSQDCYRSLFHPVSIVQSQILRCAESLEQWSGMKKPDNSDIGSCLEWPTDGPGGCDNAIEAGQAWIKKYKHCQNIPQIRVLEPFHPLLSCYVEYQKVSISTLYRTAWDKQKSREEEIVGLLSQITHESHLVADQIIKIVQERYEQYTRKELRSRQRKTYTRMLDSIPVISGGLRLVLMISAMTVYLLDDIKITESIEQLQLVKLFKSMLQYTELLMTNSVKNRWEEAVAITTQIIDKIHHYTAVTR